MVLSNYIDRTKNAIILNTRKSYNYSIYSKATQVYGCFVPNPSDPIWENRNRLLLGSLHPSQYFSRPNKNMTFHNLCSTAQTPPVTEFLLRLGLEYCIESPRPFQRMKESIRRMQRSVLWIVSQQIEQSNHTKVFNLLGGYVCALCCSKDDPATMFVDVLFV
jgi:hypothetical protein